MSDKKKETLEKILPTLQTGDVILVSGRVFISEIIEFFERSPWTHVCIVVKASDIGLTSPTPEYLIWESNDLTNLPDVMFPPPLTPKKGPQLVDLVQRLKTDVQEKVDAAFMTRPLKVNRTPEMFEVLKRFIPTVHDATFPSFFKMAWEEFLGRFLNINVKRDNYFCSELISQTFMEMGIISDKKPANAYLPKDFAKNGKIPFIDGVALGEETHIEVTA